MNHCRGLTLLEVLIASAILSIMAVTCIPLARSSLDVLRAPAGEVKLYELAIFADLVVTDPVSFGLDENLAHAEYVLPWPEHLERTPVVIRRLISTDEHVDHTWLTFSFESLVVSRWIARSEEDEEEGSQS